MTEQVRITRHDKYVLVSITVAAVSPALIQATLSRAVEEAAEHRLNFIIHRESPSVKPRTSITNLYGFAVFLSSSGFKEKLALVFPGEMRQGNFPFFGDALKNRGVKFRLLSDIEEAIQWIATDTGKITS